MDIMKFYDLQADHDKLIKSIEGLKELDQDEETKTIICELEQIAKDLADIIENSGLNQKVLEDDDQ